MIRNLDSIPPAASATLLSDSEESTMSFSDANASSSKSEGKYAAMFVCWLLGIGCLFSWNSMLTIGDYYLALFPRYHPSRVLTLVYQPFALGTIAILIYNEAKLNTRRRNLFGFWLFFLATLLVLVLDLATSGKGGIGTYIGICIISGAFGVADAHAQGGMIGDLSFMEPLLLQSFLAGLAASGAITSGLRLITKAAFENSQNGLRKGAILFFAICTSFELLCVLLYAFVFPKLPIIQYYRSKAASEGCTTVSSDLAAGGVKVVDLVKKQVEEDPELEQRLSNKVLFLKNIDYAIDMFLIYVLTLSIFPGFLSEDTGSHSLGEWYALVLIAMYNVWDLIGRFVPLVKWLRMESRKGLMIATVGRFLLVPAFYFTAKYGDQGWMIMLTSFLGLSNGYLTVCVLTAAPKGYKGPEQNALGNLLVFCLLGGIFAGVTLDWLWLIGKGW
ncbi:equilibrative nucleotide transporter 3-like [Impatiens glandulifera]|uniref:equilibrative nucleotide transporter 3-like n=1 Tax=Impatiens glandulifera TaxID=253017 RepID=UPI001FB0EE2C|nr:equilibrative nucleotide transporter 3-like [Impatiens glandulifera]